MKTIVPAVIVILLISLSGCKPEVVHETDDYTLIPLPVGLTMLPGEFRVNSSTKIVVSEESDGVMLAAQYIARFINGNDQGELDISVKDSPVRGAINLVIDTTGDIGPEGYRLEVSSKMITVTASSAAGLFYGLQTVRQLLPPELENPVREAGYQYAVPACSVVDEPRFVYRGMHLDVARHMFPVEYVKRYIDMLALHKMNTFHWHLTEDQGMEDRD
ncbi:MAG: glycoside hydrolase family 20 zincin-like fold domain-containing protein [Bacteroidales bacterium]